MSRIASMTLGLVLIFFGAQLYLVKSYLLTPTATRFVEEHFNSNNGSRFATPAVQTNGGGFLRSNAQNAGWNSNGGATNSLGQNGASIGGAPAGQSWPYYRTNNGGPNNGAGNGGAFSNSSFQSPVGTYGATAGQPATASANALMFGTGKRFVPPRWIMWPALFLGSVLFLHGVAIRG